MNRKLRLPTEKLKVSLVAVDLDGTLLRDDSDISQRTAEAIHRLAESNIVFALATGRLPARMPTRLAAHPELRLGVFCNGALIARMPERELLFRCSLDQDVLQEAIRRLHDWEGYYECFSGGEPYTDKKHNVYFSRDFYHPSKQDLMDKTRHHVEDLRDLVLDAPAEKLFFPHVDEEEEEKLLARLAGLTGLRYCHSTPLTLEINHEDVSKLNGLRTLADVLGVPQEEVLVFGDADNDLPMLEGFPLSVAMGNAPPEVACQARFDAPTNEEDGVAWFLENYVI